MDNTINFTGRSNTYFAITKKGWQESIPDTAYNLINNNRKAFEKFARKNNIKLTFTDARNMLSEFHSGSESSFLNGKMAIEVEKRPSLIQNARNIFSNFIQKFTNKKTEPQLKISVAPYYAKNSKNIPSLKETSKIGFYVDYEPYNNKMQETINLTTVVNFLQKTVGKKSNKLSNLKQN